MKKVVIAPEHLLPQHQALLDASAITQTVAAARGYRSITKKSDLRTLGFTESQCAVPALLVPIRGVMGDIVTYQARPDRPRINNSGKPVKYETPGGSRMALDVPPAVRVWLDDPSRPLYITEGARKADAAVSQGLCCIALLGVWNWRGTNEHGGKTALPDWEMIALNGRETYICFDSDVMTKPAVHEAMTRLKAFLIQRGAKVRLIYLPQDNNGAKTGLDDFLASGYCVDELLTFACDELQPLPQQDTGDQGPYRIVEDGLWWAKPTREGEALVQLTNFLAQIVAEVVEDDGLETRRFFELEAQIHRHTKRFTVSTNEFGAMNWPLDHLGATAVVYAGFGVKEHARVAIQSLNKDVLERRVFVHTGWTKIDQRWVYLHAGGAIGSNGPIEGIEVHPPDALQHFVLQCPQDSAALREAVHASLALLDVAPDTITLPSYASLWRAVMGTSPFSLHLVGPTGAGKTVLASLIQQHWGSALDSQHLPGSWSSTGNALEAMAFAAKDALIAVDDFAPGGTSSDLARYHHEADRLFRAQGNNAGRGRMRSDGSLRPAKPPRGLILSTGEDVPRGESCRARLFALELSTNTLHWEKISSCQRDAATGCYSVALAGFIQWLAVRYDRMMSERVDELAALREATTTSGQHRRVPDIIANLAWGFRYFLTFAQETGSIDAVRAETLWKRCWIALGKAAAVQLAQQASAEPTERFTQLLRAAISSGRAHVVNAGGSIPPTPSIWGWRDINNTMHWQEQGALVGWIDGKHLFLEPDASYAVVQRLANEMGDSLSITPRTLHKRLCEKGVLASTERERHTMTVRRVLAGSRRTVLHMHADIIMPTETAQTAHEHQAEGEIADLDGHFHSQFPPLDGRETAQTNCPTVCATCDIDHAHNLVGTLGNSLVGEMGDNRNVSASDSMLVNTRSKPGQPCHACRGTRFWNDGTGRFICAVCHPPAKPDIAVQWVIVDEEE